MPDEFGCPTEGEWIEELWEELQNPTRVERSKGIMSTKKNPGIDYGNGATNVDKEIGIRYGVISQYEVLQAWTESSEPFYDDDEYSHATDEERELIEDAEPISFVFNDDGYDCEAGEDGDIFIIKSPYFTYCQFCSPCAPGAGYLMNWYKGKEVDDEGILYKKYAKHAGFPKAYCFGHDWFEGEKAPYPVFDVKTGELVESGKE